jgi:uncharacterized membrane protein YdfJ with MMPL/SSD domain
LPSEAIGSFAVRFWWLVLLAWVVAALAASLLLPPLKQRDPEQ